MTNLERKLLLVLARWASYVDGFPQSEINDLVRQVEREEETNILQDSFVEEET